MKNIPVIGTFLVMLAVFVTILALPADTASVERENRSMSPMPKLNHESVFSGEFASDFESYLGDNVGLRSNLTSMSKSLNGSRGITNELGSVVLTDNDIGTGTTIKVTLLLVKDTVMVVFARDRETEKLYIDAINTLAENLPENIKLYNMLIPTQLEFREPIYKNVQDDQIEAIKDVYSKYNERVNTVNIYDILSEHSDEYVYFRTDHHWTQLGAYYAYRAFADTAGVDAVDADDYDVHDIEGVYGYLYDRVNMDEADKRPDTVEWYDLDENETINVTWYDEEELAPHEGMMYRNDQHGYTFFFGSDFPLLKMENTAIPDGKTIVIIKDSFANAFAPWLAKSYKRVILVDPRTYPGKIEDVVEEFNPDEVMVMDYVFATRYANYCELLKNVCE